MNSYRIEDCSTYKESIVVASTPIFVFDDHNMALPAWGVCSYRQKQRLNLLTFDYHTDTHPSFHCHVFDKTGEPADCTHLGLNNPEIMKLLDGLHYELNDFDFEDIFKLAISYVKNDEQILTGVDLGYLSSYTVVTRDESDSSYETDDRLLGYNATYLTRHSHLWRNIYAIPDPILLDFDLDYFGSRSDFDSDFMNQIAPLVKRAKAITIAREPIFFEKCRTDEAYTNTMALHQLIECISSILGDVS